MDCLNCSEINRDDRRFCRSCGTALPMGCSGCGFANDAGDTFCGGCGQALGATASAPEPTPKQEVAIAPVLSTISEGRRQLTVMFCDLVGSTTISEQLDPEEMARLLTDYRKTCSKVVEYFGGFIGKFMGDGLLIYFGYPHAQENDPQRAIEASLAIVSAVEAMNGDGDGSGPLLRVRIGINTGLVVTGEIGTGGLHEKMAIVGDTPNIAARLQNLAKPGTVLIGGKTHRLVDGFFVCDFLGPKLLKGLSETIDVYQVRQSMTARGRFEAKLERGRPPLAGRSEEIGLLFSRWEQVQDNDGQVVLISGEAGVGKSRILQSLQSTATENSGTMVNFVCSNYRKDTPFHPVIDFLERILDAGIDSEPEEVLDRLDALLLDLNLTTDTNGALIASMLSLPTSGRYQVMPATLEDQKTIYLKPWFQLL